MSQKNIILTPFHHRLLKMRLLEGKQMDSIACDLGLSRAAIAYHFRSIHRILNTHGIPQLLFPQYTKYIGSDKILIELNLIENTSRP